MTDRRSLSVIAAALAASAGALATQIADSDKQAIPVNMHTALGTLSTAASDLADAVDQLAAAHEGTEDTAGLADRLAKVEQLLTEAGITPSAPSEPTNAPPAL